MAEMSGQERWVAATPLDAGDLLPALQPIGSVVHVGSAGSRIAFDLARVERCAADPDPAVAQAATVGSTVKVRVGPDWALATVRSLSRNPANQAEAIGEVDFLGESAGDPDSGALLRFRRGLVRYPLPGARVYPATNADLHLIYGGDGRASIAVGTVHPSDDIPARLAVDALLGKHFALLGSTGTGKSTAAAMILHRICAVAPEGHIVMVDPHGEYTAAFRDTGLLLDVSNLQMPYWLMNFEEHCEVFVTSSGAERQEDSEILARCLTQARGRNRLAQEVGKTTVDTPIPYLLSDLTGALQAEMGKLDKASSSVPFLRLKSRIEEIRGDPRYQFMFSGMLVGDTMSETIARIFRLPAGGKPISIIDVSGVPGEITATVVAVLSRLIFDFALWSRREGTRPILLVCEEAHRYVPNERNSDGSSVGRILSRIAKEGRKYGISLGLITQRPSDLAEGVLSQCGTILAMRLNNERDQAFVRAAMPEGARGFLDAIPALRNRECIACGEGVPVPIRIVFDDLEESRRPASSDPSFCELWRSGDGGGGDMVERTVGRWRSQGR